MELIARTVWWSVTKEHNIAHTVMECYKGTYSNIVGWSVTKEHTVI